MKLGFISALPAEGRTLHHRGRADADADEWRAIAAGAGATNAIGAAADLIDWGAEALVSWGTAGSLDPRHGPGTLLLYDGVVDHTGRHYVCDVELTSRWREQLAPLNVVTATGYASDAAVATAHDKLSLGRHSGCIAVDMESGAIAAQAAAVGVPLLALRAIVDPAGFSIPAVAFAGIGDDGEQNPWRVLRGVIRRPRELPELIRLAWWYRGALSRLQAAAVRLGATSAAVSIVNRNSRGTRHRGGSTSGEGA